MRPGAYAVLSKGSPATIRNVAAWLCHASNAPAKAPTLSTIRNVAAWLCHASNAASSSPNTSLLAWRGTPRPYKSTVYAFGNSSRTINAHQSSRCP